MRWYDLFSWTYDLQLERTYRPWRTAFIEALDLKPGMRVLDLGCGTGQDFDLLVEAVGPEGEVVGLDLSSGMLDRARARIRRAGWDNVRVEQVDLCGDWSVEPVDAVAAAMVFSALPDPARTLDAAWSALRSGGVFGILDAYASQRTFQTRMVEWIAQADLDRAVGAGLEERSVDFQRRVTEASPAVFGGELVIATGRKPDGAL